MSIGCEWRWPRSLLKSLPQRWGQSCTQPNMCPLPNYCVSTASNTNHFPSSNLMVMLATHSPRMSHGTLTTPTYWKFAWGALARASKLTRESLVDPRSCPPQVRNSVQSVSGFTANIYHQARPRVMLKMTCPRRGVGSLVLLLGCVQSATTSRTD